MRLYKRTISQFDKTESRRVETSLISYGNPQSLFGTKKVPFVELTHLIIRT